MDIFVLLQAIFIGFFIYASITHLMIGIRSRPRDLVQLSFALLSLFFAGSGLSVIFINLGFGVGSASQIASASRTNLFFIYMAYGTLYWFINLYTGVKDRLFPGILSFAYILIAISNFLFPFPSNWAIDSLELTGSAHQVIEGGLVIVYNPWYRVEVLLSLVILAGYTAVCTIRQQRRGERSETLPLAVGVGILIFANIWDTLLVETGLVPVILMTQNGVLAFLLIMSLRLSGRTVESEKELRRMNIKLEDIVEERTAELSTAKDSAEAALEELLESETRLDYVLRSARLAVWEYDLQTRETAVTDVFPHLLGYEPDELLVDSDEKWRGYQLGHQSLAAQLLYPDDKERYAENLGGMIAGEETFEVEYRLRMADGRWNWIRDHGKIVKWDEDGKPLMAYGVLIDIDGMKNLQLELIQARDAAEAANRAKSVFLANMSHELRTPLNAILGFTQIMERDPEFPPQHKRNMQIIDSSGEHLLDLINDVLEMSKIESGHVSLEVANFDLFQTLNSLESILRVRAENKGLELKFEYGDDVPRYIRSDERKLRQVLFNLLGNAIKFTEKGDVVLHVKAGEGEQQDETGPEARAVLYFTVQDTGVGIAPEEMDRLFEAFTQTESGQVVGEGTGLGLPISQQFVGLMGGAISVESQLRKGSTFQFDIPVEVLSAGALKSQRATKQVVGLAPEGPNYRILIVDDSYENRLLLEQMLSEVGFEVLTANDGKSAIELYQAWNPHLIWMDIRMPEMDGYQATRIIRESEGPETKIIAVSASAFEEEQARVLEAGCDDFVRKPFSDDEIFDVMAEHLGVRYICEDITPDLQDAEGVTLTPVDLKELPEYWVAALRSAATRGRNQELLNLIGQIEAENPEVAKALRDMVENFGYKDIVDLTG